MKISKGCQSETHFNMDVDEENDMKIDIVPYPASQAVTRNANAYAPQTSDHNANIYVP